MNINERIPKMLNPITVQIKRSIKQILKKMPVIEVILRRYILSRILFPEIEMWILSQAKRNSINIAIDIGAAKGGYSWILASKQRAKRVVSFEPSDILYKFMKSGLFYSNIELHNLACGSYSSVVEMYSLGKDEEGLHTATISTLNPISQNKMSLKNQVNQVSLDEFFEKEIRCKDSVDFIKIDVEGYESEVIMGGVNLVRSFVPLIICEIEARHNPNYRKVFDFLLGHGYTVYYYANGHFKNVNLDEIISMQNKDHLGMRLSGRESSKNNKYINNFIFQHPKSRFKMMESL